MKKANAVFYFLLLAAGLAAGLMAASRQAYADSPVFASIANTPSVVWDERWTAIGAYASSSAGYQTLDPSSGAATSAPAAAITGSAVSLQPKMVVTKWKIHGHLHFH